MAEIKKAIYVYVATGATEIDTSCEVQLKHFQMKCDCDTIAFPWNWCPWPIAKLDGMSAEYPSGEVCV